MAALAPPSLSESELSPLLLPATLSQAPRWLLLSALYRFDPLWITGRRSHSVSMRGCRERRWWTSCRDAVNHLPLPSAGAFLQFGVLVVPSTNDFLPKTAVDMGIVRHHLVQLSIAFA